MQKIIVYGAGGHASVVADAIQAAGNCVVGFVDDIHPERKGGFFRGEPIISNLDELKNIVQSACMEISVAFGFGQCAAREKLWELLARANIPIATVIHPQAVVSPYARLAHGVYVAPFSVIEAGSNVEAASIVNCGAHICHDVYIGKFVSICPGVDIGGKSVIGDRTWIGIGATIIDCIHIGHCCYIGAGSVVVDNIVDGKKGYGVPAKIVGAAPSEF